MKDFRNFGIRVRKSKENNYWSWWYDLNTVRMDVDQTTPLVPDRSEFYDIGLGTKCNASCPFCYVAATSGGEHWKKVSQTWKKWMDSFPSDKVLTPKDDEVFRDILSRPTSDEAKDKNIMIVKLLTVMNYNNVTLTEKPFQIAIGSTCEPTIHPEFTKFLETVFRTNVVPNYTTNGILLSDYSKSQKIFETTANFCGGVAVSYGNKDLRNYADKAIINLLKYGGCKVMLHHIINDKESVDDFIRVATNYKSDIHYHVLLPLMKHGRSDEGMTEDIYPYLAEEVDKAGITNIALGANFKTFMKKYPGLFDTWELPEEIYSKNILLRDEKVVITPSSFNLEPIKIIEV